MKYLLALFLFTSFCFSVHAQSDSTGYYVSFDNTKIYYEVKGEGTPVLLLHGFTGTCNDWKNKMLFDSLVAHHFKVIIVDLRGNGWSDKPSRPEGYANDAEAKDMMGLMTYLHAKEYDAIGYSRGSIILARILVKDPRCKKAVIGGMGADFTDPQWPRRIGFYNALMNDTIKGYEGFRQYIAGKGLDPLTLAWQQKEQPSTSKEALAKLTLPVLIICGDEDHDNGKGTELQQLIPHSAFTEVPGNHNNTAYSPAFAKAALTFLTAN